MTRQLDSKIWANRSQQTTGNVTITFLEQNIRHLKPKNRFVPVSVQRVPVNSRPPQQYYDEFMVVDREKAVATGRWILNVIAANEAYQQALKTKQSSNKKKASFQSRKSSKVEPIETSSTQFINTPFYETQIKNQNMNQSPHHTMLTPTTIDDGPVTPLSSFSSATSIDCVRTPGRSSISSRTRSNSQSEDYSTDEFKDSCSEGQPCISKRIMITCTILAIILIVGIIIAVFITIFVVKNQSTSSNAKDSKSLLVSLSTLDGMICPTEMFNITDSLCNGQIPYNYYSCYQMATSTSFTIRFAFQHDTMFGHWYFDDISTVQYDNIQLIINGGFESNLTGWTLNISSNSTLETYVDTKTGLAHTGSAYLYGSSKNYPGYIQQTFNVIEGEYINVSFWWGYDGGLKSGSTCQAIGQLIPSL